MYTEQDLAKARRSFLLSVLGLLCFVAVWALSIILPIFIAQKLWLSIVLSVPMSCAVVFFASFRLVPTYRYQRFLREILTGRRNSFEGVFNMNGGLSSKDGLDCHLLYFIPDGETEPRLCYFDAAKTLPELSDGQRCRIEQFGNIITALEAL